MAWCWNEMFAHVVQRENLFAISVIEKGPRWWNIQAISKEFDPVNYLITRVRASVDAGKLPSFAVTQAEIDVFKTNNVTTLAAPLWFLPIEGYNSGNALLCLCRSSSSSADLMHL